MRFFRPNRIHYLFTGVAASGGGTPEIVYPSIRDIHVADTYTNNSQEVTVFTTDVQETDLLLLIHAVDSNETINAPTYTSDSSNAGYGTAIETIIGDDTVTIWAKEAELSDEGEHIEVTWGSIERAVLAMIQFKNHDGVNTSDIANFSGGTATVNPVSPSIETTVDNCLIIYGLVVDDNNTGNFPYPSVAGGHDIFLNTRNFGGGGGGVIVTLAAEQQATAGFTDNPTWTISASRGAIAFTIAIAPGSKGGTSSNISTGLTEMWDLEDGSALNDSNLDLNLQGSASYVTGLIGDGLQTLPSPISYANTTFATSSGIFPETDDMTLVAWMNPDSTDSTTAIRGLLSIGDFGSSSPYMSVTYRPNILAINALISDGVTVISQYIQIDNTTFPYDQYGLFIVRFHRVGFVSLIFNGVYYGQRQISSLSAADITPLNSGLRIGYSEQGHTSKAVFDSVMIYKGRIIEFDKIPDIYNEGNGISSADLP